VVFAVGCLPADARRPGAPRFPCLPPAHRGTPHNIIIFAHGLLETDLLLLPLPHDE